MDFQFDNQKQTIMGVPFDDPLNYRATRDAVLFNVQAGWEPTVADVKRLRDQPLGFTPEDAKRYERITGQKPQLRSLLQDRGNTGAK